MKEYSFLTEVAVNKKLIQSPVPKILSTASMAALGSSGGSFIGKHAGNLASNIKYNKIDPETISWSDPDFLNIVKRSLVDAKNNVKLTREWYLSCDKEDKRKARVDYLNALLIVKEIEKDIADKNPFRWISEYKKLKRQQMSQKYQTIGKNAGAAIGGIGTAASWKFMK